VLALTALCVLILLLIPSLPATPVAHAASAGVTVYANAEKTLLYDPTNCNVPMLNCPSGGTVNAQPQPYTAQCQQVGDAVSDLGYTNVFWSLLLLSDKKVWVSNVYIKGGEKIEGVPDCPPSVRLISSTVPVEVYSSKVWGHSFDKDSCKRGPQTGCGKVSINQGTQQALCQGIAYDYSDFDYPSNHWWSLIKAGDNWAWVSNIYIKGDQVIAGVPGCTDPTLDSLLKQTSSSGQQGQQALLNITVWKDGGEGALVYPCTRDLRGSCRSDGVLEKGPHPAYCQKKGEVASTLLGDDFTSRTIYNDLWTLIKTPKGRLLWLSNVYITTTTNQTSQNSQEAFGIDGQGKELRVPNCGSTPPDGVSATIFNA
jgi:hypothetical protein